ncbi:MAG: L-threonylcarbamoyladenylate synthase [Candidatus Bathyarchaeota archaeon]|nr:L-threonylcarbamoyladenylate synthase [Candidatus Bathyarchaeota archaeon]
MKKTILLKVNPRKPEMDEIHVAAALIKSGGLVAFPTETVYGLGADALNPKAVRALFAAKKRPPDNPPIVHISNAKDVHKMAKGIPCDAEKLMKAFWPGPLTLIFKRSPIVPDETVCGLSTIAIRMPRHNVALALIKESGCPIAAPSANLAGKPSPTSAKHVMEDLEGRIDAVLDGGPTRIGVESTVLDLTVDPPEVLRPGGTSLEKLKTVMKQVVLNPVVTAEEPVPLKQVRSPGLKHKHYAPKADLIVVEGDLEAVAKKIIELTRHYIGSGRKVGILATDEAAGRYAVCNVKSMGSRSNSATAARNLFRLLREFDSEVVDIILAEGVPTKGLGLAVMNRLRKASGYTIIKTDNG